jgi:iron-sulfur cluster assembly protein
MNLNITMTEAATTYIKKMLEKNHRQGFRLSIKKTGCSGYSYVPTLVENVNPKDQIVEINGIMLYVDSAWEELLQALTIDYVEEEVSGIKQKHLVFINPKEAGRCGCGESFNIE